MIDPADYLPLSLFIYTNYSLVQSYLSLSWSWSSSAYIYFHQLKQTYQTSNVILLVGITWVTERFTISELHHLVQVNVQFYYDFAMIDKVSVLRGILFAINIESMKFWKTTLSLWSCEHVDDVT